MQNCLFPTLTYADPDFGQLVIHDHKCCNCKNKLKTRKQ